MNISTNFETPYLHILTQLSDRVTGHSRGAADGTLCYKMWENLQNTQFTTFAARRG